MKQSGLAFAGLSLAPLKNFALTPNEFHNNPENDPIRLSSNENPYGPSPLARNAMSEVINISNRYQWKLGTDLIVAIASKNNVSAENVLIAPGSTEILDTVGRFAALKKGNFIVANPSFSPWAKTAENLGLQKILIPLDLFQILFCSIQRGFPGF